MALIQQSLGEKILIMISQTKNAKKAWDILKEYQGYVKSSESKLYAYQQAFETIRMKNGDFVHNYVSIILTVMFHIRALGE